MQGEAKDSVFEALWGRVLADWEDDKTHAAVLDHAVRVQTLAQLASHYRALAEDPARGPGAKKKLDAIALASMNLLLATKTPARGKIPLTITLSAVAVSLFVLLILGWALWGQLR